MAAGGPLHEVVHEEVLHEHHDDTSSGAHSARTAALEDNNNNGGASTVVLCFDLDEFDFGVDDVTVERLQWGFQMGLLHVTFADDEADPVQKKCWSWWSFATWKVRKAYKQAFPHLTNFQIDTFISGCGRELFLTTGGPVYE